MNSFHHPLLRCRLNASCRARLIPALGVSQNLDTGMMVAMNEKKKLLDDLRRGLDDYSPGSVSVLVRKALMLAALCDDSTYEMLFELHLLGLEMWVKSGNKETWQRRGVEDNDYVAKANVADRRMLDGNVNPRPLDDLERLVELTLEGEKFIRDTGLNHDPKYADQIGSYKKDRMEAEQILTRIRSRVALFAAKAQLSIAGQTNDTPHNSGMPTIEISIVKRCPKCHRIYADETFGFCLEDGTPLSNSYDPDETLIIKPDVSS